MKRILFFLVLSLSFFCLTSPVWAQASASIGAHYTANQNSQPGQFGADFAAGYRYRGFYFGGESSGNDGNPLRARYLGSYPLRLNNVGLELGGGYFRFGQFDGGFGQIGLHYEKLHGWGRLGNDRFLEAEAAYDLADLADHFTVQVVGRGTRHEVCGSTRRIYQAGLRLNIR